jgi:hypothetical protein
LQVGRVRSELARELGDFNLLRLSFHKLAKSSRRGSAVGGFPLQRMNCRGDLSQDLLRR